MTELPSISDILSKILTPVEDDEECPICHDILDGPVKLGCRCRQSFCSACISRALTTADRCPLCRFPVLAPLRAFDCRICDHDPRDSRRPTHETALDRVLSGEIQHSEVLLIQALAIISDIPILNMLGVVACTLYGLRAYAQLGKVQLYTNASRGPACLSTTILFYGEATMSLYAAITASAYLFRSLCVHSMALVAYEAQPSSLALHLRREWLDTDVLSLLKGACYALHTLIFVRSVRCWWSERGAQHA